MSNFEMMLDNLQSYDSYEIDGLGPVNIRKPGIDDIELVENLQSGKDAVATGDTKATAEMIARHFIVDEKCQPIFNDDNVGKFMTIPMDILLDIIVAFRKTFDKLNKKAEELQKKP